MKTHTHTHISIFHVLSFRFFCSLLRYELLMHTHDFIALSKQIGWKSAVTYHYMHIKSQFLFPILFLHFLLIFFSLNTFQVKCRNADTSLLHWGEFIFKNKIILNQKKFYAESFSESEWRSTKVELRLRESVKS